MIQVIVATNRKGSRSKEVAEIMRKKLSEAGSETELMVLEDVDWSDFNSQEYGSDAIPSTLKSKIEKIDRAEGLYIVCPEYNGSFPGAMKLFIDYWNYPTSFEHRPVCFIGLGGMFGGLRPVEQLQQVFGYRNAFIFPDRIFLQNVWSILKEGQIADEKVSALMDKQAKEFVQYVAALKESGLHANAQHEISE